MDRNLMRSSPKLGSSHPVKSHGWFRGAMLVLAFVLACQAFWILAAGFYRLPSVGFPAGSQSAAAVTANREDAHIAALIGYIRGDLWADELLTYPSAYQLHEKDNLSANNSPPIEQIRNIAERALSFAPHDSRTWLVLANIDSRFDWLNKKASNDLRMSYYTGANEVELIPLRLSLAVSFSDISVADFQQFVRHDIGIIVTKKPELKSAIQDAYRYALPDGRQFIEATLKEMDPTLLSKLQLN
jgi:hypothetical protein